MFKVVLPKCCQTQILDTSCLCCLAPSLFFRPHSQVRSVWKNAQVWNISDIQSEDGSSWAVCNLQTYSLSPLLSPLYYHLSLGTTIFELCCHPYQKACCRGKGRMQKKSKWGLANQLVLQARATWQRDCITVSCALIKHRAVQDSWLSTWLRKGETALMALWLPGLSPPELVLPLTWLKELGNWASPGGGGCRHA